MAEIVEGEVGRSFEFEGKEYFVAESVFDFEPMPMPKFEFNYPARWYFNSTSVNLNPLHGLGSV